MKGIVTISLDDAQTETFLLLKKRLGVRDDVEVVRYAVNQAYLVLVGKQAAQS